MFEFINYRLQFFRRWWIEFLQKSMQVTHNGKLDFLIDFLRRSKQSAIAAFLLVVEFIIPRPAPY